ncbi:uncharacterized protein LOC133196448 [Saccostrea echinata]|uniref:uncharacterized protein LOC133196448 n=1 Tax=Saccostrea echinata TaxID=191078 RepID=UPI002A82666A|nr:uncharacterized protein LOC133196448 [Saccostrea echinata]
MLVVEERTLLFRKNISRVEEEGTYLCRRLDVEDYLKSVVKSVSLVIEYEPVRDITNFDCILHEQRNEFYCSWNLGLYNHPAYLDITVVMSPDNGSTLLRCPQKVKQQQNCTWTAKDDHAILSTSKIVILTIKNVEFDVEKTFIKDFSAQSMNLTARITSKK